VDFMLVLHGHPLASFCMKVEMALYELGTSFRFELVDLGDEAARDRFHRLWPIGRMPVLQDLGRGETVPETSIIIEYLAVHHPGRVQLIPRDPDLAWRARLWDRFHDLHVQGPFQRLADHRLGRPGARDEAIPGVVRDLLATACGLIERDGGEPWLLGETFSIADCSAAPALFYADRVLPLRDGYPRTARYLERLKGRPSFARTLEEAAPYLHMVPF
jgi:glutathione S-transferase